MATFSVDRGFKYGVPAALEESVAVGSIVRVPLSGRRVRGFVVELRHGGRDGLKDLAGVSGNAGVFSEEFLRSARWISTHYVAPLSVVLERAAPPNLPRIVHSPYSSPIPEPGGGPLATLAADVAGGHKGPVTVLVGRSNTLIWLGDLAPIMRAGRTVLIILATATEAEAVGAHARDMYADRVVVIAGDVASELTGGWEASRRAGSLVVGTPRAALWDYPELGLAAVIEEGRRAMKDRQTPTLHVRDVMLRRSRIEGFGLVFAGPTPTVEVLAAGPDIVRLSGRAWPPVEVVDRSGEAPGAGYLSERVISALRAVVSGGGRCFVFTHRRATEASMRCRRCRAVHVCTRCGSRLGRLERCRRCGLEAGPCQRCGHDAFEEMGTVPDRLVAEINRKAGDRPAGVHPGNSPIVVGTERDLAGLPTQDLVVAADADGLILGHDYRASEEALRVLARLGCTLRPGTGHRMMVQTSIPDSAVIKTLLKGDPVPFIESTLVERVRLGLPPSSEMMAVEIRGADVGAPMDEMLRALPGAVVLGPAPAERGARWLLQGDLGKAKLELRSVVQRLRDGGATVRVDADPIDL